jgi:protein-tyrosine kinase
MSRVHDALRKAAQLAGPPPPARTGEAARLLERAAEDESVPAPAARVVAAANTIDVFPSLEGLADRVQEIPFNPSAEALLIDLSQPQEAPMEEFRSLRTRLNHLQTLQPIHTVVITSASPAEGKSFTAINLALTQAQLAGNRTLVADFDFRRPILHNLLQIDRAPGITDFLMGKAPLEAIIRRVSGTNLYVMPAGEAVMNPLELLNLREVKLMLDQLPAVFNWIILDTPPLLFAADANLLATMCHGTVLVVRIGATTIDAVTRAMQSLCENNVLGIVVNGARRGELYSKYAYYHAYYSPHAAPEGAGSEPEAEVPAGGGTER